MSSPGEPSLSTIQPTCYIQLTLRVASGRDDTWDPHAYKDTEAEVLAPIDCIVLILVGVMCTWSVHSYLLAVSRKREARAMARKLERRVRLRHLRQTRDWSTLPSCLVVRIDPKTLAPLGR